MVWAVIFVILIFSLDKAVRAVRDKRVIGLPYFSSLFQLTRHHHDVTRPNGDFVVTRPKGEFCWNSSLRPPHYCGTLRVSHPHVALLPLKYPNFYPTIVRLFNQ